VDLLLDAAILGWRWRERGKAGPYVALNAAVTHDQAAIIFRTAHRLATHTGRFDHWLAGPPVYSPFPLLKFAHGAELWCRSLVRGGEHIRGHQFHRINVDEARFCTADHSEVLELCAADHGAPISYTTSPGLKGGRMPWHHAEATHAWAEFEAGNPRYYFQTGSSYENPHIDHAELDAFCRRHPRHVVEREILGRFVDSTGSVFLQDALDFAFDPDLEVLNAERYAAAPVVGARYVDGWDLARKSDWTVGITLRVDRRRWELVAFERYNRVAWPVQEERMRRRRAEYDSALSVYDATGIGDVMGGYLGDGFTPFVFTGSRPGGGAKGTKPALLDNLVWAFEQHRLRLPLLPQLRTELECYEWDDKDLETDSVMALALAVHAAVRGTPMSAPRIAVADFGQAPRAVETPEALIAAQFAAAFSDEDD